MTERQAIRAAQRVVGMSRMHYRHSRDSFYCRVKIGKRWRSRTFSDRAYGGRAASFEAGRAWLAEMRSLPQASTRLSLVRQPRAYVRRTKQVVRERSGYEWLRDDYRGYLLYRGERRVCSYSVHRWGVKGAREKALARALEWQAEAERKERQR